MRIEGSSASPINSASFAAMTSTLRGRADVVDQRRLAGQGQRRADELELHVGLRRAGHRPGQHRLLRLQVLHPGGRLRRRGSRRRAARAVGHPEPARADRARRRRRGRNGSGDRVDVRWTPNPECDVIGYRLYRSTARACSGRRSTAPTPVPPRPTVTTRDWCVDETAPATGPLYLHRRRRRHAGERRAARGHAEHAGERAGERRQQPPDDPVERQHLHRRRGRLRWPRRRTRARRQIVVRWDASTDSDGSVAFYRIYRDGTAYANRWDDFFPAAGGILAWLEYAPRLRLAHLPRDGGGRRLRRVDPSASVTAP